MLYILYVMADLLDILENGIRSLMTLSTAEATIKKMLEQFTEYVGFKRVIFFIINAEDKLFEGKYYTGMDSQAVMHMKIPIAAETSLSRTLISNKIFVIDDSFHNALISDAGWGEVPCHKKGIVFIPVSTPTNVFVNSIGKQNGQCAAAESLDDLIHCPEFKGVGVIAADFGQDKLGMSEQEIRKAGDVISSYFGIAYENAVRYERMQQAAMRDSMTGLYNHSVFYEMANAACANARRHKKPLAVAIIDIDDFKKVNDRHGHIKGDEVLIGVSRIIRKTLRGNDIVARYGGEEFGVILPDTAVEGALYASEKLRTEIASAKFGGISVTVSIGVAAVPAERNTKEYLRCSELSNNLIQIADEALYMAKSSGKNCVKQKGLD